MNNEFNDIKEFENKEHKSHNKNMRYSPKLSRLIQYKSKLILFAVIILVIVIVISVIIASNDNSDDKKTDKNVEETTEASKETEKAEEKVLEVLSTDSEIHKLVTAYIDAAYVNCDEEALGLVVDSLENVDVEKNTVRQRYIESYNNVECYLLDGKDDINVVFVAYDVKLYNYDVLLPAGETLKVKKASDDVYKIHNIEVGEQFEEHMTNKEQANELALLQEKIQSEYNAVIDSNSEIKSIIDILNGAKTEEKKVE